jgi:hypothetical protein
MRLAVRREAFTHPDWMTPAKARLLFDNPERVRNLRL